jgi:hypothetical protein
VPHERNANNFRNTKAPVSEFLWQEIQQINLLRHMLRSSRGTPWQIFQPVWFVPSTIASFVFIRTHASSRNTPG